MAANMIGERKRIIAVLDADGSVLPMLNPRIVHTEGEYNHRADDGKATHSGGTYSEGSSSSIAEPSMPRYRVAIMEDGKKTWLPWMRGMAEEGGSSDSFAGEPGWGIVDLGFDEVALGLQ